VLESGVDLPQDAAVARPSATFEEGRVGGSTGCNRFTGSYTLDGDSLELGQLASTQMACIPPADAVERAYLAALGRVAGWRSEDEELVLVDSDETEVLRYAAATPVGTWQATAVQRGDALVSPIVGTELTATFAADGNLSGSAGCNRFTASYTTDKGSIEIGMPAATRKACAQPEGVMEQESAYLALLPTAVGYRVDGRSLELSGADGTLLVAFTRG
jgi:heat shock protein HslJ